MHISIEVFPDSKWLQSNRETQRYHMLENSCINRFDFWFKYLSREPSRPALRVSWRTNHGYCLYNVKCLINCCHIMEKMCMEDCFPSALICGTWVWKQDLLLKRCSYTHLNLWSPEYDLITLSPTINCDVTGRGLWPHWESVSRKEKSLNQKPTSLCK